MSNYYLCDYCRKEHPTDGPLCSCEAQPAHHAKLVIDGGQSPQYVCRNFEAREDGDGR